MALPRLSLAFAFAALGLLPAAALDWRQTTQQAHAAPFQKTVALVFDFKNTGPRPVHVLDLQTSCSCLAATSDQSRYAPGDTGQIHAQFSAEEPPGLYERQISVLTDESPTPQRLTVQIEIPELALLTPRSVEWHLNETAAEKSIELRVACTLHLDFTQAVPSNDSFAAKLTALEPGRIYLLTIRPLRSTAQVANAAIRLQGHDANGHEVLVSAYANVR